jgi:glyoxylase-like metal-dependent hydrolase (beta-lactamase superfamily II)
MNIYSINTGNFKLDGGAMFGVVPKSIWNKLNPADENNMISLAMRCLLIEVDGRVILIDNGIGNKQDEKFFGYYYLHGTDTLDKSLQAAGFTKDDITDCVLTHLHFDHCGGSISWNNDKTNFEPTFKNAKYWVGQEQWYEALQPNAREKASFLKENILPIQESGHLNLVNKGDTFSPEIDLIFTYGHTNGMMHPVIKYKNTHIIYLADVIPTIAHIPIPYVMGYDVRPLNTMQEKTDILNMAAEANYVLFFEHDPNVECCTVKHTDKGVKPDQIFKLSEI